MNRWVAAVAMLPIVPPALAVDGEPGLHDPSTVIQADGKFYAYARNKPTSNVKKGDHIVRAAIVNGGGATDFCARFIDEDGNPIKGFTVNLAVGRMQR